MIVGCEVISKPSLLWTSMAEAMTLSLHLRLSYQSVELMPTPLLDSLSVQHTDIYDTQQMVYSSIDYEGIGDNSVLTVRQRSLSLELPMFYMLVTVHICYELRILYILCDFHKD